MKHLVLAMVVLSSMSLANEKNDVNTTMHFLRDQLTILKPFLASDEKSLKSADRLKIEKALKSMDDKVSASTDLFKKSPTDVLTFRLLNRHIGETRSALERGEVDYARMRVRAIPNFCQTCHMRFPLQSSNNDELKIKIEGSQQILQQAKFEFITRNYDLALARYDLLLKGFPQNGVGIDDVKQMLRHKMSIFARIKRDGVAAQESFAPQLQNKEIARKFGLEIKEWLKGFQKITPDRFKGLDEEKMLTAVQQSFSEMNGLEERRVYGQEVVELQFLSGILYEKLFSGVDEKRVPQYLLYLGKAESVLNYLYFYPLGDIYFKECVEQYPKNPIAKLCFQDYANSMREKSNYFYGRVTEDIENSIQELKNKLK